jgi:UDP-glucuronate 4-epimerase
MKTLVTGGAGFIGSHVVRALLHEGHEVTVLDDFNDFYNPAIKQSNLADINAHAAIIKGDLRDERTVQEIFAKVRPEVTFHLAARAGVRPSILHPKLYLETNVNGTFHVLEAARLCGCERMIFASSSSVYGLATTIPFHEELALPQTLSPYAATKLAGEQLCGNFSYLYGMKIVALRFFTVYGPGQRPDLAIHAFTDAIAHGRPIKKFGDGSTRRDYTYIDDIVQGVLGAMRYDKKSFDIFNLGGHKTTSLSELIVFIEKAVGCTAIIEEHPEQKGDMPLTYAEISKAQQFLGYNPQTSLEIGIPKFVEWYRHRPC